MHILKFHSKKSKWIIWIIWGNFSNSWVCTLVNIFAHLLNTDVASVNGLSSFVVLFLFWIANRWSVMSSSPDYLVFLWRQITNPFFVNGNPLKNMLWVQNRTFQAVKMFQRRSFQCKLFLSWLESNCPICSVWICLCILSITYI